MLHENRAYSELSYLKLFLPEAPWCLACAEPVGQLGGGPGAVLDCCALFDNTSIHWCVACSLPVGAGGKRMKRDGHTLTWHGPCLDAWMACKPHERPFEPSDNAAALAATLETRHAEAKDWPGGSMGGWHAACLELWKADPSTVPSPLAKRDAVEAMLGEARSKNADLVTAQTASNAVRVRELKARMQATKRASLEAAEAEHEQAVGRVVAAEERATEQLERASMLADQAVLQARAQVAAQEKAEAAAAVVDDIRLRATSTSVQFLGATHPVHVGELRMSGTIEKQGGGTTLMGRKNWQARWFVLEDGALAYYNDRKAHAAGKGPLKNMVIVVANSEVGIDGKDAQGRCVWRVTPRDDRQGRNMRSSEDGGRDLTEAGKVVLLRSATIFECRRWMKALKSAGAAVGNWGDGEKTAVETDD